MIVAANVGATGWSPYEPYTFGVMAYDEWIKSFQIRTEIAIDESIIMPNHLHRIVMIHSNKAT
ncbi:MAG: hypothetical protein KBD64_01755 [Gammaproteobacteria bacterium]|nr:hypothetical protein [Gammaproteobacteria bacterium]